MDEPAVGSSSGAATSRESLRPTSWRRRHSTTTGQSRRHSVELDADAVWIKVDLFVSELERRLASLEQYGNLQLDAGITRAYTTLDAVRESCGSISGELMDAGRRRAKVLVDVLEPRYNDALAAKTSLEAKAHTGIKMMESWLSDLETRAHATYNDYPGISDFVGEGRRRAESSLKNAKEAVEERFAEASQVARDAADSLKTSIENGLKLAAGYQLIKYDDLPVPWRVNPHITRGYRFSANKKECIVSMFQLSNETINIWSHGLGLVLVVALAFFSQLIVPYFFPTSPFSPLSSSPEPSFWTNAFPASSPADYFFLFTFLFAAAKCLVCSTLWHTMSSIADQTLLERFACVDYTGISLLIAASIVSTEYAAFYCEPVSRWTYIILTLTLGIAGSILPWHPTFNRADMSGARVLFYVTLGATGFAPMAQLAYYRGWDWTGAFYAPIGKSVLVYLLGAMIYAAKLPEKIGPKGWFDYVGGSHNIWHMAVLGGILFHYGAMWQMFEGAARRAANGCSLY